MDIVGNIKLVGLGHIANARVEQLEADPDVMVAGLLWYNTTDGVYRGYDGTTVITFSDASALAAAIAGAGLQEDGSYLADEEANYIDEATSLFDADQRLDAALKALEQRVDEGGSAAGLQGQIDAIEVGAGLQEDGSYLADEEANYIDTATSLYEADQLLDAAIADLATSASGALQRAGGTMAGNIEMDGNFITGLPSPVNANDAATKAFVEATAAGLDFQADVLDIQVDDQLDPQTSAGSRYIITDAENLAEGFGTISGVDDGDIVQHNGEEFVVAYDVSEAGPGALLWNRADSTFYFWDGTSWNAFGGMSGITAGTALEKDGNVLNVLVGDNITIDEEGALSVAIGDGLGSEDGVISLKLAQDSGLILDENGLAFDSEAIEGVIKETGGTMTGPLVLAGDPANDLEAATRQYVDAVRTDLQNAADGATFIYDGSVSAATHEIEHGIGSKYCNVTVVDSSDQVIIPDNITFVDENSLTVGFVSAITCKVIVTSKYVAPAAPEPEPVQED